MHIKGIDAGNLLRLVITVIELIRPDTSILSPVDRCSHRPRLKGFVIDTEFLKLVEQLAHMPVVEQTEAVGHAVRAGYMYAAMADVGALTGDPAYGDGWSVFVDGDGRIEREERNDEGESTPEPPNSVSLPTSPRSVSLPSPP